MHIRGDGFPNHWQLIHTDSSDTKHSLPSPGGSWSSLVGIVTAIVGNVLISFALNVQRYAHVRLQLEDQQYEREDTSHSDGRRDSYGAIQRNIAEERAKLVAQAEGLPIEEDEEPEALETDQLIPPVKHTVSDDSQSTLREFEKSAEPNKRTNYLRSPYWWIGMVLMVIGETGNFLAYGFAAASIVSPLGVVALISNCLIAPVMFKENFRKRDFLGVVIAVVGAVIIVVSAKSQNPRLGPNAIWKLISTWEFETYFGITVACIFGLMAVSHKYGQKTILIDIGLVGLFGGYTALSTKGVASLLSYRLWKVITFPITYLLVFVLVLSAVMQVRYINRALQRFDSTQVIPTQFCIFTIFVVLGSAILYRDFEQTTADKVGEFFGGVVLTFLGVWCITSGRVREKPQTYNDYDAEEHEIDLVDEESEQTPATPQPARPATDQLLQTPNNPIDSPASFATARTNLPLRTSSSPQIPRRTHENISTPEPSTSPSKPSDLLRKATSQASNAPQTPTRHHPSAPSIVTPPSHASSPGLEAHPDPGSGTPRFSLPNTLAPPPHPTHRRSLSRLHLRRDSFTPNPFTSPLMSSFRTVVENARSGLVRTESDSAAPFSRRRSLAAQRGSVADGTASPSAPVSAGARARESEGTAGAASAPGLAGVGALARRSTGGSGGGADDEEAGEGSSGAR